MNEPDSPKALLDAQVSSLLERKGAARAFHQSGLGHCIGCVMAPFETLREAVAAFGLDPKRVLRELEQALEGGRL